MRRLTIAFSFFTLLFSISILGQEEKPADQEFSFDKESNSIIPNYVGKINIIRGRAYRIANDKKKVSLKKDMKVYKEDIIETTKGTLVKIQMVDNTTLTIGPSSEMKFDHFVYRTKKDRESVLNLIKGKMRVHFNIKAPRNNALKVKVKHVSMGVRGTKVLATTDSTKGYHQSQILLIEGEGFIEDKHHEHEQIIKPKHHYISSTYNNKKHKKVLIDIKDNEHDHYKGKTAADKDFLPLLPFHPIKDSKGNVIKDEVISDISDDDTSFNPYQEEEKKPSWKNTLKELNKKLTE